MERVEPTNLRIDPYYIQVRMEAKSSNFSIDPNLMKDDRGSRKDEGGVNQPLHRFLLHTGQDEGEVVLFLD